MTTIADYKVLILDDHALQCAHMAHVLEMAGFVAVETVQNVPDALACLEQGCYDLVILDLEMPGMDGVQFIHALAARQLHPMLVITTACSRKIMNSVSLMAKEKGLAVIGAFSKPFVYEYGQILLRHLRHRNGCQPAQPENLSGLYDRDVLERALREGRLQAWFQPKKALATGQIVGAEALARWVHPEFGFILPGSFMAAVQQYALDRALLMRMLEDALAAYQTWLALGFRVPVSINLPTRLLDDPDLPDVLYSCVSDSGVPIHDVCFELLESETTQVPGQYYMGASRLRLKGFGLAQDDFGRGYSSMYGLISTPFTELKIDRAFVSGAAEDEMRTAALLFSVQLGRQLGLSVTAEGVETHGDLELLRRIGCDNAQGYLLSAALAPADFSRLLVQESAMSAGPPSDAH